MFLFLVKTCLKMPFKIVRGRYLYPNPGAYTYIKPKLRPWYIYIYNLIVMRLKWLICYVLLSAYNIRSKTCLGNKRNEGKMYMYDVIVNAIVQMTNHSMNKLNDISLLDTSYAYFPNDD